MTRFARIAFFYLACFVFLACGGFFFVAAFIWLASRRKAGSPPDATADAVVVLGAAAWGDEPSPAFEARLRCAVEALNRQPGAALVLTGGVGESSARSEAEVGRDYAIARGVDPARILLDDVSRTTYGNLFEARKRLDASGAAKDTRRRIVLVSDPEHMVRASLMARDLGFQAHLRPRPYADDRGAASKIKYVCREAIALIRYVLRRQTGFVHRELVKGGWLP